MASLVGEDVVQRALARVPPHVREEYEAMTALSRVPTDLVEQVYYAIAEEAGREPLELHREAVRIGVEQALKTIWRVLLTFTSDKAIIKRTPLFFARGLSRGKLSAQLVGEGRAEMRLVGWPGVSEMQRNGIAAAAETVLRCAGRYEVRVRSTRTPDGARFDVTWR